MRGNDTRVRSRLLEEGRLYEDYAEDIEALHISDAEALKDIVDEYGWPGISLAGQDGAQAKRPLIGQTGRVAAICCRRVNARATYRGACCWRTGKGLGACFRKPARRLATCC